VCAVLLAVSVSTITDKPHHPYHARLSHREYADYSARSQQKYSDAKLLNNGLLNTSRSGSSRTTGGQIMSPRSEHVAAFAAEFKNRQMANANPALVAAQAQTQTQISTQTKAPANSAESECNTTADVLHDRAIEEFERCTNSLVMFILLHYSCRSAVELLHPLHGTLLTPRAKFAYPQTSSQEIGWISEPLTKPDHSERELFKLGHMYGVGVEGGFRGASYVGRTSSAVTEYANTYIAHHHHSPFSGALTNGAGHPLHGQPDTSFLQTSGRRR
jgi:hypothetical protein